MHGDAVTVAGAEALLRGPAGCPVALLVSGCLPPPPSAAARRPASPTPPPPPLRRPVATAAAAAAEVADSTLRGLPTPPSPSPGAVLFTRAPLQLPTPTPEPGGGEAARGGREGSFALGARLGFVRPVSVDPPA